MADDSPDDSRPEPAATDATHALAEAGEGITAHSGLADALARMDNTTRALAEAGEPARGLAAAARGFDAATVRDGGFREGFERATRRITAPTFPDLMRPYRDMVSSLPQIPPDVFRDHKLDAALEANDRLEELTRLLTESQEAQREVTRLLAESQEAQRIQAKEHAHKEAEQVAREERALELAAKSHAETVESKLETRRARILAAWSLAVAVLALIAAVVVPLIIRG